MSALLDAGQLRSIDRLRIAPRRSFGGKSHGERLTKKRGISIEFSDYRAYVEGDDLRHLDWNILARLEQPVMKTYRDEEDLAVYLMLDCSASMAFGQPDKFEAASRLAWALGYIGLAGGDMVQGSSLRAGESPTQAIRGRANLHRLSHWITGLKPENTGTPTQALKQFLSSTARPGVVLLISDGMDPDLPGLLPGIGARGHDLLFLQVLSDLEFDPDLEGDLRLIDAESGTPIEITANSYAVTEYRKLLKAHQDALEQGVHKAMGRYLVVRSSEDFNSIVNGGLRRQGWVKS